MYMLSYVTVAMSPWWLDVDVKKFSLACLQAKHILASQPRIGTGAVIFSYLSQIFDFLPLPAFPLCAFKVHRPQRKPKLRINPCIPWLINFS